MPREGLPGFRASLSLFSMPPPIFSGLRIRGVGAKSSPLGRSGISGSWEDFSRRSGAAIPSTPASVTRPPPGWGFRAKSRSVCAKELGGGGGKSQNRERSFVRLPLVSASSRLLAPLLIFFFPLFSFNLISSNSTFVVTGVTPGSANPILAISLSKRLGQP